MKKKRKKYRFLLVLLIGFYFPISLEAQLNYPTEKVEVWADRYLFISGEDIQISGVLTGSEKGNPYSKVVNIELITPYGEKISQTKFSVDSSGFIGKINISPDVLSGYYYLRAYTKWMRNGSTSNYSYIRLKVINPFTDEVMLMHDSLIEKSGIDSIEVKKSSRSSLDKKSYQLGETIHIIAESNLPIGFVKSSLSIIPSIAAPFDNYSNSTTVEAYKELNYYPETRGITISGKVIRSSDRSVLAYHKVNIHLENERDFISVLSDSIGRFYIALPERYGNSELFVIAATLDEDNVELLIDQDYCNRKVNLKVPLFSIKEDEKAQLLQMAQSYQLDKVFEYNDSLQDNKMENSVFYGDPYKTIDFDSYVALDSLSQYFTDLPSWVKVKVVKGKRKIQLSGIQSGLQLYEPLILVDWIPVDDVERILAMDPRRIQKFDVVISSYIHGGITYGGILAIFTRKSDFAGLEFPASAMYINYDFYAIPQLPCDTIKEGNSFKNTFTWLPNISSEWDTSELEFTAPSIEGNYTLLFQAINLEGKRVVERIEFEVIKK